MLLRIFIFKMKIKVDFSGKYNIVKNILTEISLLLWNRSRHGEQ